MRTPFNFRTAIVLCFDLAAACLAWIAAYALRFNLDIPAEAQPWAALMLVLPLQAAAFYAFGLYRGVWRFASLPDLRRILLAIGLSAIAAPSVFLLTRSTLPVPRSIFILDPILLLLLMGGARFLYRAHREGQLFFPKATGKPVMLLGAGPAATRLAAELTRSSKWQVIAMLDDDPQLVGCMVAGLRVLGKIAEIGDLAPQYGVRHVIIAMPEAPPAERRRAAELAARANLSVLTVPSAEDLLSGQVSLLSIRPIELEDLLKRHVVQLELDKIQVLLAHRVVLVTGAGGSIGAELCRQIARFKPSRLVLLELSEFALYKMEEECSQTWPDVQITCLVGDVKNAITLDHLFKRYAPSIVFHAAAYKHVPLMEDANAWEAIRNNVSGTLQLALAARRYNVEKFVLISTDKAVNPTNVMGASKRLAEMVCQAVQKDAPTQFITVRFGNVLGSNGSVIPKFREQIAKGGPITVTHPDIIRYFMLIPEAAQLVLQAGAMGKGGEIFVLDMGEPVRIVDLARDAIRLSGLTEEDIKIVYTGLRPGEKLYEELLADGEFTLPTSHPKVRVAKALTVMDQEGLQAVRSWLEEVPTDTFTIKQSLAKLVPEYSPQWSPAEPSTQPAVTAPVLS